MIHALAFTAALVLSAAPPAVPPIAAKLGLDADAWQTLQKGEVVAKTVVKKNAAGKDVGNGRAWVIIKATPDACYATLSKYEETPKYMPRVEKVTIADKTPTFMRVTQAIKVVFSTYRYTMDFTFDPKAKAMTWVLDKKAKNDIADTSGKWSFLPLPGGTTTLLDYTVAVDTGAALPSFLSNYLTKRDLPGVLDAFRKRVESGGKWTK